jgi:hypothetical protein
MGLKIGCEDVDWIHKDGVQSLAAVRGYLDSLRDY